MPLSCGHGTKRKSFGALSAPRPHRTHVVPNKKPVILSLTSIINIKMSTTWLRPWMTWRQDEILKKKLQSFQSRQDWMITLTPTLIGLSTVAVVRLCEGRVPKRFHPMSSHHGCLGTHSSALCVTYLTTKENSGNVSFLPPPLLWTAHRCQYHREGHQDHGRVRQGYLCVYR